MCLVIMVVGSTLEGSPERRRSRLLTSIGCSTRQKVEGDTGNSGGGSGYRESNAWVHHNTIAQNKGQGGSAHAYGGGMPSRTNSDLR